MTISSAARRLARALARADCKVVFAESCTGGFVAASLTRIPGISQWHCGGVVTYRNETKQAYLEIPAKLLREPGPVSEIVARKMALGVLKKTPEAKLAAAVTGHLGPNAPAELDGVVFIAIARRTAVASRVECRVDRYQCTAESRTARQREVIEAVLARAASAIEPQP